ncbi:hypothetical protein CDL12_12713 [Handroanthus impetiginosus]|uniref:Bis(5'-adenosyl)-triphosphatase n=1 Tax=Handroanthus impetiginosus TaxID=429701 RepID=A0A2G9HAX6_9LAMI|nr:hypothetical protein CDL12_12713 [Handroanthus impetiginosus]
MLKQLPLLSSRYSLTPFLYLHSSTRHRFRCQPSLSLSPGRAFSSVAHNPPKAQMESESYSFGPYTISSKEVFYTTQLSFAFVNLRPVVPGHILFLCPHV